MIRRQPRVALDVIEQTAYIGDRSYDAGYRFPDSVEATFRFLEESPRVGRARRFRSRALRGVRSWPVKGFGNHLVFYKPIEGGILVIAVVHAARDIDAVLAEN